MLEVDWDALLDVVESATVISTYCFTYQLMVPAVALLNWVWHHHIINYRRLLAINNISEPAANR